jgi:hypothetical protein
MGLAMEITWAIYGGAFCAGALAAVTAKWAYGEWLWRLDRGSVVMPDLPDSLLQKAAMAALLEMIERDRGDDYVMPTPVPTSGLSQFNEWGLEVPSYEGEDVVS